jgi:two-component system, NarL family, nitrate/nitrite response regulator NarL
MSRSLSKREPVRALRVAIVAFDRARLTVLSSMVLSAGHRLVDVNEAEVLLLDGPAKEPAGWQGRASPVVRLGTIRARAPGSLDEDADAQQVDAALRAVAAGLIVRSRSSRPRGLEELHERDLPSLLTPRELEVLSAISDGLSNKAIGRRLAISLHTVKFHVEALFRKLEVRTRAEAVAKSLERGFLDTFDL